MHYYQSVCYEFITVLATVNSLLSWRRSPILAVALLSPLVSWRRSPTSWGHCVSEMRFKETRTVFCHMTIKQLYSACNWKWLICSLTLSKQRSSILPNWIIFMLSLRNFISKTPEGGTEDVGIASSNLCASADIHHHRHWRSLWQIKVDDWQTLHINLKNCHSKTNPRLWCT